MVEGSGRVFAFAKATDGVSYVDPTFAANWVAMKQAGLVRGAYHYFEAGMDRRAGDVLRADGGAAGAR